MLLLHACNIIIGEVHHIIWGKSSHGIIVCWEFPQVIFFPFACEDHFHKGSIERYLIVLIDEGPVNCMRDEVSLFLLFFCLFAKRYWNHLGKAASAALSSSVHMVSILAFFFDDDLNSGPYFSFHYSCVKFVVWVDMAW